jgi:hypothetical protein
MNDKPKHVHTIQIYRTYAFKDKDPVIDKLRTLVDDEGEKHSKISEGTGVSTSTLHNWFHGPTRRPQHATIAAVASYLGYEMVFKKRRGDNVIDFRSDRLKRHKA